MFLVNLYGAPGSGKSTGAAYIFSQLKMRGINAELVTEFAKDKVWEESKGVFNDQLYIFAKQHFRISRVGDKVDVIITDAPLLLSSYYGRLNHDKCSGKEFDELVKKISGEYDTMDVFIDRVKPYNPNGRLQTEKQSDNISAELEKFLNECGVFPMHYTGNELGYSRIVNRIITRKEETDNEKTNQTERV